MALTLTKKNKVLIVTFVLSVIILSIIACLIIYFVFKDKPVPPLSNKQVDSILEEIYKNTSTPKSSDNNMLDIGTSFGYDDIHNSFVSSDSVFVPRDQDVQFVGLAGKIVEQKDFVKGNIYGGFSQLLTDNMSMPISIDYAQTNIVISGAYIYFDTSTEPYSPIDYKEYKIIIDYDSDTGEYVMTILTREYLSKVTEISVYYKKHDGFIYINATGTFDGDSNTKKYSVEGYDSISKRGLTNLTYDTLPSSFRSSCDYLFSTEVTKLNNVYANIASKKDTAISYSYDMIGYIREQILHI